MNAALAFAILSLVLQISGRLFDWKMATIDLPIFSHQLSDYEPLGIRKWFSSTEGNAIGEGRTRVVLRMAMLSASTRATLTSFLTCLVGLGATCLIVATARPAPFLVGARMGLALAFGVIVLAAMILLFVRLIHASLCPVPINAANATRRTRFLAFARRHVQLQYLTMYSSVIFIANAVTIITALGV